MRRPTGSATFSGWQEDLRWSLMPAPEVLVEYDRLSLALRKRLWAEVVGLERLAEYEALVEAARGATIFGT